MKYIIGIIIGFWCVYYFDIEKDIEKTFDTIDYSITKIEDSYDNRQSNSVSE